MVDQRGEVHVFGVIDRDKARRLLVHVDGDRVEGEKEVLIDWLLLCSCNLA
jgi:hypothetical protein